MNKKTRRLANAQGEAHLSPTLWRTCRALAHRERLRIIQLVMRRGVLCVGDVSTLLDLPLSLASAHLRVLNARGILSVQRVGRFVWYRLEADPSVWSAAKLVETLRLVLAGGTAREREAAYRDLTAYTHPRRIALAATLTACGRTMNLDELEHTTRISRVALLRHLTKLQTRGVVRRFGRTCVRLMRPRSPLSAALLELAAQAR